MIQKHKFERVEPENNYICNTIENEENILNFYYFTIKRIVVRLKFQIYFIRKYIKISLCKLKI